MTRSFSGSISGLVLGFVLWAQPVFGQSAPRIPAAMLHSVPGEVTTTGASGILTLSLSDAITRGLEHNLALVAAQSRVRSTDGDHLRALSALLPHVEGSVRQSTQVVNLAAFGFTGFPGIEEIIGPFDVFDARIRATTPIIDLAGLRDLQSARADQDADRFDRDDTRQTVILVVGSLYLQAVTDRARVDAVQTDVDTAQALLQLARDQQAAGVAAGIDVLRQEAQVQEATVRAIAARNAFDKDVLRLARAIGLPADQAMTLSSQPTYTPAPEVDEDALVADALSRRRDVRASAARVEAARASRRAAAAAHLPSLHLEGDWGRIGTTINDTASTYTVAASVHVPIFDGGASRARAQTADAELAEREAELADLQAGVRFDVTAALLDVKAADARVHVAETRQDLARQELTQAEDRFRAGVSSSLELTQAQQAVAAAAEQYIASVEGHILAKAALARATGQVEERFVALVEGAQ